MGNKLQISSTLNCDVLIIGAGGAGMRCAAHLLEHKPNLKIFAVTKVSHPQKSHTSTCLLYTSDAADDLLCVDLGGRRIIKKKKTT